MTKRAIYSRLSVIVFQFLLCTITGWISRQAFAQAIPYAREYHQTKPDVDKALKELGAYSGQKLPIVDGIVATGERPLDRYERAFYQFSIDVLPGPSTTTVVRLTAKITACVRRSRTLEIRLSSSLPRMAASNSIFSDRLSERVQRKPVASVLKSQVQAPAAKLDLSTRTSEEFPRRSVKNSGESSRLQHPQWAR